MKNDDKDSIDESREISLRIEQYDDIFSDFDVRPYDRRALSADFLEEIKRASYDKSNSGIELTLYVPEAERDASKESDIAKRLSAHFQKHFLLMRKDKRKVLIKGVLMVVLGAIFMVSSTMVAFLELVGIFLLWEGMDQILFVSKTLESGLDFYRKMSRADGRISFQSGS